MRVKAEKVFWDLVTNVTNFILFYLVFTGFNNLSFQYDLFVL